MKIRGFSTPKDLTSGRPLPLLIAYSVPMLINMFFQQAYNLVDSYIAGNQIGDIALGAVGTCYPVTVFFIAIASGLSMGTSIHCSQTYGGKKYGEVKTCITTSLCAFLPLSVILAGLGFFLCPMIVSLLNVPGEAVKTTVDYLRIYILGFPFLFLYNIANASLNGLGDSRSPLIFLILSSICNIFLDYALVVFIPMGTSGLALATLISQAIASVASIFAVWNILKQLEYKPSEGSGQKFSKDTLKTILGLGIPSAVQHMFMSTGQLVLQNVINGYGIIVMAGYSVAFRINGIVINSLMAISNAFSGFAAQNKGAKEYERIKQGYRITLIIGEIFSVAVVIVLLVFGAPILSAFIGESPDIFGIVDAGMGFFRIVSVFYPLVCLKIVSDGALRGIGEMKAFLFTGIVDVMVRILCGGTFSTLWGINGVWSVWPTAWLLGTMSSFGFYMYFCKKKLK